MSEPEELTPELLERVFECIRVFQEHGQVVTLDAIATRMERKRGVSDRQLIEAAAEELERQKRIATLPLYWQKQD